MTDNTTYNENGKPIKTFGNPPIPVKDVVDEDGNTYCQVHTDRETGLRCNNCDRLMCAACAVSTPVGYRCQQCVHQRESTFFNADTAYYVKLAAVTTVLGAVGAFIANSIGFIIFVFFIGAAAGGMISEAALRVTKGKRGRYTAHVAAGGVIAGTLIMLLLMALPALSTIQNGGISPEQVTQLIEQYGEQEATEIIEYARQQQSGYTLQILGYAFLNFSVWFYAVITAATVYGRFNIYNGSRKR